MAVAEKVGFDRRGNTVYKRRPDGEVILEPHVDKTTTAVRGRERTSPSRAWSAPSTMTCRKSRRRTRLSAKNIPSRASSGDHPTGGARLPLLPVLLVVDLDRYHVLAGANGAGKTTLLDIPVLIGDMLRRQRIVAAFLERAGEGDRAASGDHSHRPTPQRAR